MNRVCLFLEIWHACFFGSFGFVGWPTFRLELLMGMDTATVEAVYPSTRPDEKCARVPTAMLRNEMVNMRFATLF